MATAAVQFTVVGVDKASQTFTDVGESARKSADKISRASEDAGSAFDGAAEGADTLASKGSQAAGALAGLGEVIGGPVGGAMVGLGGAFQIAADSGDLLNAAIEGGGKVLTKAGAAARALTQASTYQAAASKVAAAGQWLLNAAMSANPIGLIIAGIVLVVGALVLFFTKTEAGRQIFAAAWGGIQAAAQAVGDWFTGTLVPALSTAVDAIGGFFTGLADTTKAAVGTWRLNGGGVLGWVYGIYDKLKGFGSTLATAAGDVFGWIVTKAGAAVGSYAAGGGGVRGWLWSAVNFVTTLPSRFGSAAGNVFGWLTEKIAGAVGSYAAGGGGVKGWLWSAVDFVSSLPGKFKSGAGGLWDWLTDGLRGILNSVIGLFNNSLGDIGFTVPSWVPGVGGRSFKIPKIPYLFTGGTITNGGWAVVGERGPEVVNLPGGSTVYPNHAPPSGIGGPKVHVENFYAGGMTPADVADAFAWEMGRAA